MAGFERSSRHWRKKLLLNWTRRNFLQVPLRIMTIWPVSTPSIIFSKLVLSIGFGRHLWFTIFQSYSLYEWSVSSRATITNFHNNWYNYWWILNQMYSELWIGNYGPLPWPPRSHNENPLDFYFWSQVRSNIYVIFILDTLKSPEGQLFII